MLVLGIETSCDETGLALYEGERGLLAHVLYSQVELHADYGGVVPDWLRAIMCVKPFPCCGSYSGRPESKPAPWTGSPIPPVPV